VEVLDTGSRGLFGLGSRQARIRLSLKSPVSAGPVITGQQPAAEVPSRAPAPRPSKVEEFEILEVGEEGEDDHSLRVARETVSELLEKMKVRAKVFTHYGEVDDPKNPRPILVEIRGDDLSILIGRRSETLMALQYISSLIVGKELERWVPLLVDVEGYRARRERQLRQLARRMAEQAISTGRRQVLEPMPANERRVIHLELRNHPDVMTESIGEEPNRKVTIVIKK